METTSPEPAQEKTLQQLRSVRETMLVLHKVLLDYQREVWERTGGQVGNSYALLNLVMKDPHFAWLHRLSELIVQFDELLADKEPLEPKAIVMLEQARLLLTPSEAGDEFQQRYFEAMQRSPDVVVAHSDVLQQLGKKIKVVH